MHQLTQKEEERGSQDTAARMCPGGKNVCFSEELI